MTAYTLRPFTEDERAYVESVLTYMRKFQKMRPLLAVGRLLFSIGISTLALLFLVLGIFGQSHLTIALTLLMGFALGNTINRAWTRAALHSEAEWENVWREQWLQWEQLFADGMIEDLRTPVTEFVLVGSETETAEEDCVAFLPVGDSETLCLFTAELEGADAEGFPGAHLTVTRFPGTGTVYQVSCTGKSPKPLCNLEWSDFAGFVSAESFYGWLKHGKVYPIAMDQIEQGLISLEELREI